MFVAFVWFATTVPLGSRTLFGHVRNIAHSAEATELVEGTKSAAKPLVKKIEDEIASRKNEANSLAAKPAHKPATK